MNLSKLLAIVMIVAGALGLAYGGFSYTKETHTADIGSVHMSVDEKGNVNIPAWAGLGMLVIGVALLAVPRRA